MFDKIDKLQEKIAKLRPLNKTELEKLRENFIIENTYNSNAIEGNTLTLRETALILQQGITIQGKKVREHLEVIGYKDAFYYILDIVNEPLTKQVIKDIHSLVLMHDRENKGVFRRVNVQILGSSHKTSEPQEIESNIFFQIFINHDKISSYRFSKSLSPVSLQNLSSMRGKNFLQLTLKPEIENFFKSA